MAVLKLVPESVDVLVGSLVTFECQVESWIGGPLKWKCNNKSWGLFDTPLAPMITSSSSNWTIYSRRLTAQREHNESFIQCVVALGAGQDMYSNLGVLLVRGETGDF